MSSLSTALIFKTYFESCLIAYSYLKYKYVIWEQIRHLSIRNFSSNRFCFATLLIYWNSQAFLIYELTCYSERYSFKNRINHRQHTPLMNRVRKIPCQMKILKNCFLRNFSFKTENHWYVERYKYKIIVYSAFSCIYVQTYNDNWNNNNYHWIEIK